MDDILHGGRDDMRGYGGRVGFTTFARIFTGSLGVFGCLLGVVVFVCLVFLLSSR